MERTYLPVLLLLGFVAVNAIGILALSHFLTRARPTPVKQEAYESGMPVIGDARERFSVKFYMVAMLFIVFDIETVFMIPWGAYYQAALLCTSAARRAARAPPGQISFFGLGEMIVFIDRSSSPATSTCGRREPCNGIESRRPDQSIRDSAPRRSRSIRQSQEAVDHHVASTSSSTGVARTPSGRCRSAPPAARSSSWPRRPRTTTWRASAWSA